MARQSLPAPWQAYLDEVFPGYLLPAAMHHAIAPDVAARFLRYLGAPPNHLELLVSSSLLAGRMTELGELCRLLDDLTSCLPSRTHVHTRHWEGGFHGRIAVAPTLAHRLAGEPTRFVTLTRTRTFDLPENELVRWVAERLCRMIFDLHAARMLSDKHWGKEAVPHANELERLLTRTALHEVPAVSPITGYHLQAANAAGHPCYKSALRWHGWLDSALDLSNPARLAQILADGALRPLKEETQFEIAVLMRLIQAIERRCQERAEGWELVRSIILKDREDIACFRRSADGAEIRIFYNLATEPWAAWGKAAKRKLGPRDRGVQHYFGSPGRLRPDITVVITRPDQPPRAVVMDAKNSDKTDYHSRGYGEALLYRHEYGDRLLDWPKSVLICASDIAGAVSRDHEVVAVDWRRWVPDELAEALVPAAPASTHAATFT